MECRDGSCEEKIVETNDRIIYTTLIAISCLCIAFAIVFAHARRRKPEIPDYIVTDNGETLSLSFSTLINSSSCYQKL